VTVKQHQLAVEVCDNSSSSGGSVDSQFCMQHPWCPNIYGAVHVPEQLGRLRKWQPCPNNALWQEVILNVYKAL
jgi:hypothetical protein